MKNLKKTHFFALEKKIDFFFYLLYLYSHTPVNNYKQTMSSITMTSANFADKINSLFEEYLEICDKSIDDDIRMLRQLWKSDEMQAKISNTFAVEDSSNKKTKKKKKDKNAPKKGKTAFIFWSNEERLKIAKEVEQGKIEKFDNKKIISELATRWASFKKDGGDVSKYEEMALKDKERYVKQKEEYSSSGSDVSEDEQDGKAKNKKAKKNTSGLKRNKSAYLFYTSDKDVRMALKTSRPDIANKDIIKALAEQWKELKSENPDEAQKYFDMASEDKLRYDSERPEKPVKEKKPKKSKKTEEDVEVVVEEEAKVVVEENQAEEVLVEEGEEEVIHKKKRKNKKKIVESDDEEEEEVIQKKKKKNKRKVVDDSDDE